LDKEFAAEGVDPAYIARNFFFIYSYLKSCILLLLVALTLLVTGEGFQNWNQWKHFPKIP